jgi:hypothetical protein
VSRCVVHCRSRWAFGLHYAHRLSLPTGCLEHPRLGHSGQPLEDKRACIPLVAERYWGMARKLRVEFEGAIYHVTLRGVERRRLCDEERDRERGRLTGRSVRPREARGRPLRPVSAAFAGQRRKQLPPWRGMM